MNLFILFGAQFSKVYAVTHGSTAETVEQERRRKIRDWK